MGAGLSNAAAGAPVIWPVVKAETMGESSPLSQALMDAQNTRIKALLQKMKQQQYKLNKQRMCRSKACKAKCASYTPAKQKTTYTPAKQSEFFSLLPSC